ncbi:MAG: LysR family transcriptional regulator [Solirubrobacterales bacterium]|nr:LysR family transcriptional regulator [Solirubrobacterales bacterium]
MDLRTIECFLAVIEEGAITRAADRLHLSQPPLTVRLKTLEAELGVELLHRHGRGVEPTAAGRLFAERARRLLGELDITAEAVRSIGHGISGHLTIAIGSSVAPSLLADLVGQLSAEAPEVALSVTDRHDPTVLDLISHGEADAGLLHLSPGEANAHTRALETAVALREPLVAVLREDHPAASADRADLSLLTPEPLIAPSRASAPGLHAQLLATWRAHGSENPRIRETDSTTTTLALVQAGLGVTMMPASLADVAWSGLRRLPLRQHHSAIETAIAWRSDATSPVLRRFLRIALSTPEPDVLGPQHARTIRNPQYTFADT